MPPPMENFLGCHTDHLRPIDSLDDEGFNINILL